MRYKALGAASIIALAVVATSGCDRDRTDYGAAKRNDRVAASDTMANPSPGMSPARAPGGTQGGGTGTDAGVR